MIDEMQETIDELRNKEADLLARITELETESKK